MFNVPQRFQLIFFLLCKILQHAFRCIEFQFVAGADLFHQLFDRFERCDESAVNRVAVEDPRISFGDDRFDPGNLQSKRSMFTGGTAAEVLSADDNGVFALPRSFLDEGNMSLRQP